MEYELRRKIYEKNTQYIRESNVKEGISFKLAVNKYADLSNYEFRRIMA